MDFSNTVELLEKLYKIRERLLWRDELGRQWARFASIDHGFALVDVTGMPVSAAYDSRSFRPLYLLKNLLSLHGAMILMEGWIA